jgi:hypothetical protein
MCKTCTVKNISNKQQQTYTKQFIIFIRICVYMYINLVYHMHVWHIKLMHMHIHYMYISLVYRTCVWYTKLYISLVYHTCVWSRNIRQRLFGCSCFIQ